MHHVKVCGTSFCTRNNCRSTRNDAR